MWLERELEGAIESCCLHLALQAASPWPHFNFKWTPARRADGFRCVCEGAVVSLRANVRACVCVRVRVFVGLTLAVAQVLDLDAFLLLTGRFLHLAGVVIGTTVWGTHWVEADVGTVDVADTPTEQEIVLE